MDKKIIDDIIYWFEGDTITFINKVVLDNILDPQYSAVTCGNRIIRLIQVNEEYIKKYKSIEAYLDDAGYSEEYIDVFMKRREKESEYYVGEIYSLQDGKFYVKQNE